jgi:hypothetical protein
MRQLVFTDALLVVLVVSAGAHALNIFGIDDAPINAQAGAADVTTDTGAGISTPASIMAGVVESSERPSSGAAPSVMRIALALPPAPPMAGKPAAFAEIPSSASRQENPSVATEPTVAVEVPSTAAADDSPPKDALAIVVTPTPTPTPIDAEVPRAGTAPSKAPTSITARPSAPKSGAQPVVRKTASAQLTVKSAPVQPTVSNRIPARSVGPKTKSATPIVIAPSAANDPALQRIVAWLAAK